MKLRFKTDDVGMYVAFALFGAGLGLMTGSAIMAFIKRRREAESLVFVFDPDSAEFDQVPDNKPREHKKEVSVTGNRTVPPEIAELQERYTISAVQLAMYEAGAITLEALENTVREEAQMIEAEYVSYASQYAPPLNTGQEEKPDLKELTDPPPEMMERLVDDRYILVLDPAELTMDVSEQFYYNEDQDSWWKFSSLGNPVRVEPIGDFISERMESIVLAYILVDIDAEDQAKPMVFVQDVDDFTAYQFELYTEDMEAPNAEFRRNTQHNRRPKEV